MFKNGLQVFLTQKHPHLLHKRLAILTHPASMSYWDQTFQHSLDLLKPFRLTAAFGPQHGARGDKQDNMQESADYRDPLHQIPVFSLYGETRKPTPAMLDTFDVLLIDLQDLGCRVYTYLATLFYLLDACAAHHKTVYILDRPNPIGRPVEGTLLDFPTWSSFVGEAPLPMRHGLTLAEMAHWYVKTKPLSLSIHYVLMENYHFQSPGFGWPLGEIPWVNPSPNAATLNMARCYPGTVLLEGTLLSEGRGTTHPLELLGSPDLDFVAVLKKMEQLAPQWMQGCQLRPCFFEPTFHKYVQQTCSGYQIHTDDQSYQHEHFKPYRLIALTLKAIRLLHPGYPLWRKFKYEYESDRLAIDLITGGTQLREWVDTLSATPSDLDQALIPDEQKWAQERKPYLFY